MFPYIVADIGGTNARFALVTGEEGGQYLLDKVQILNGSEYASFADAFNDYLAGLDHIKPVAACVAIAGPIDGDSVKMTNLPWAFSQREMAETFGLDKFIAINDFGALAVATSKLNHEHLINVKPGVANAKANKAIIGPGTGLGVAGLVYSERGWLPIVSEGGHVTISPGNALECEVIKAAIAKHGHVSAEMFISGPGLVNLYQALADVRGRDVRDVQPKDITAGALNNSDELCKETLEIFCSFMGVVAGNLALTYGAKGGVYLAGGILPRVADFLKSSAFSERFSAKGVMGHYVKDIPVNLISFDQTAFVGAAAWLAQQ